ncbi:MAG: cell division topological specificity factor MinE [Rhodocyclaceae bacterium]
MAMWIDKIFGGNKLQNAGTAKERLQFIIARERSGAASFDMQKMQQEVIDVIKRYIADLRDDQVNITQEIQDRYEVVSVNITLPESK